MADVRRPGDVFVVSEMFALPARLVGSQPIWSDDSDDSYAEVADTEHPTADEVAWAQFDALPAGGRFAVRLRLRALVPSPMLVVSLWDENRAARYGVGWNPGTVAIGLPPIRQGVTEWHESPWFDVPTGASGPVVLAVADGSATVGMGGTVRIYEAEMLVSVGASRRQVPPLRLTQRGDGLMGGAPRLIGRRSRQSSNRLLGGFN